MFRFSNTFDIQHKNEISLYILIKFNIRFCNKVYDSNGYTIYDLIVYFSKADCAVSDENSVLYFPYGINLLTKK